MRILVTGGAGSIGSDHARWVLGQERTVYWSGDDRWWWEPLEAVAAEA